MQLKNVFRALRLGLANGYEAQDFASALNVIESLQELESLMQAHKNWNVAKLHMSDRLKQVLNDYSAI